jgi:hypothetical protein
MPLFRYRLNQSPFPVITIEAESVHAAHLDLERFCKEWHRTNEWESNVIVEAIPVRIDLER